MMCNHWHSLWVPALTRGSVLEIRSVGKWDIELCLHIQCYRMFFDVVHFWVETKGTDDWLLGVLISQCASHLHPGNELCPWRRWPRKF